MANKFNKFLGDVLTGFLAPKGNLADFQHASRLFVDDTFRLAPKNKFLYYVVFNINADALTNVSFQDRHRLELNYLVKTAELPKYTLKTETLNQYNRKTNIYTSITYDPITISLHDDNNGISNMLWALYYGYYFNDRHNSAEPYSDIKPMAYMNTAYNDKSYSPFRYGLDTENEMGVTGVVSPFFDSIQLFTLSRQRFFSYLLCNPKITKWDHDALDYAESAGIVENKMTLAYDAVIYNSGAVDVDDPTGFAVLHYDNTPSPIASEEVLQNGMDGIFGDLFSLNSFASPLSYLNNIRGGGIGKWTINPDNYGNQMPYGYGTPDFYGSTAYSPYAVGGLQNYNFGGRPTLTGALIGAGVGLAANFAGNILKGFNSKAGADEKSAALAEKYNGVASPGNGSAGAARAEQVKTLANNTATAEAKLVETQNKLAETQKAEKEATDKFNDSTAKVAEQQKTIDTAQGKIDDAEASKAEANSEIDRLNRKQADLDGKLANGEITLDQYNRQTQITNQVKETYQDQANKADSTISESQKEINQATVLKANYQNSADEAFNNVTEARQEATKLDQQQIQDAKALDAAEQTQAAGPPPLVDNAGFAAGRDAERSVGTDENTTRTIRDDQGNIISAMPDKPNDAWSPTPGFKEAESTAAMRSYVDENKDQLNANSEVAGERDYFAEQQQEERAAYQQTQDDAASYDQGGGSYADYSTTPSDPWADSAYSSSNSADTPYE
jgi:hypothetical protein